MVVTLDSRKWQYKLNVVVSSVPMHRVTRPSLSMMRSMSMEEADTPKFARQRTKSQSIDDGSGSPTGTSSPTSPVVSPLAGSGSPISVPSPTKPVVSPLATEPSKVSRTGTDVRITHHGGLYSCMVLMHRTNAWCMGCCQVRHYLGPKFGIFTYVYN